MADQGSANRRDRDMSVMRQHRITALYSTMVEFLTQSPEHNHKVSYSCVYCIRLYHYTAHRTMVHRPGCQQAKQHSTSVGAASSQDETRAWTRGPVRSPPARPHTHNHKSHYAPCHTFRRSQRRHPWSFWPVSFMPHRDPCPTSLPVHCTLQRPTLATQRVCAHT